MLQHIKIAVVSLAYGFVLGAVLVLLTKWHPQHATESRVPASGQFRPLPTDPHFLARQRAQEQDIREAFFRYEIGRWKRSKVFFLSLDTHNDVDPSPAFLHRLDDLHVTVRPVSACNGWACAQGQDNKNGPKNVIFQAGDITWISPTDVLLHGGYYCNGLCGLEGDFRIQKVWGKWRIIGPIYPIRVS